MSDLSPSGWFRLLIDRRRAAVVGGGMAIALSVMPARVSTQSAAAPAQQGPGGGPPASQSAPSSPLASAAPAGKFTFRDGASVERLVPLITAPDGSLGFSWPDDLNQDWDTALLRVDVKASPEGSPFVEIAAAGRSDRQYFPAEDAGTRWLNLSFLHDVIEPGTRITLGEQGVTVAPAMVALRVFSVRPDLSKRILVLAPHPDDAEIGTFGLYAWRDSTVVTVTAGNAGSPTYEAVFGDDDQAAQYQFKGRIRTIDSITVPWQGGIAPERCFNLGYFDARLMEMYRNPDAVVPEMYGPNTDVGVYRRENIGSLLSKGSRESNWRHLVEDIAAILEKVQPDIIAAPHPLLDSHRDHEFTTVALVEALRRTGREALLLLYTNHAGGNRYPYGPAGTLMSLPPPGRRDVALDRVFSLPLDPQVQRIKLFALESQHDLRYSPTRQYQLAIGDGRALMPEKEGPAPDITYLRRGPRSNELFFVYDAQTVQPVIEAFLEALP